MSALGSLIQEAKVFLARKIPPRTWLAEGAIPHPSIGMLYAWRGSGKTWVGLDLGLAVATGTPWGPYRVPEPLPVLYVDGEMPLGDLHGRLQGLSDLRPAPPSLFHVLPSEDVAGAGLTLNLAKQPSQRALSEAVEELGIKLVVLDNWTSLIRGIPEDDNSALDVVREWLILLRHRGTSCLIIHHAGKGGAQRGASSREDQLDYSLQVVSVEALPRRAVFRVMWDKTRAGMPDPSAFMMELTSDERGLVDFGLARPRCRVCGEEMPGGALSDICSPECYQRARELDED